LTFFKISPNIKFYKNSSSGSHSVPRGETDMKKVIVAFLNFAKEPKKE